MPYILVRHKVLDVARWRAVFDVYEPERRAGGLEVVQVLKNRAEPLEVLVLCRTDDVEKSLRTMQAPGTNGIKQRAGVVGVPDVLLLDEVPPTAK